MVLVTFSSKVLSIPAVSAKRSEKTFVRYVQTSRRITATNVGPLSRSGLTKNQAMNQLVILTDSDSLPIDPKTLDKDAHFPYCDQVNYTF